MDTQSTTSHYNRSGSKQTESLLSYAEEQSFINDAKAWTPVVMKHPEHVGMYIFSIRRQMSTSGLLKPLLGNWSFTTRILPLVQLLPLSRWSWVPLSLTNSYVYRRVWVLLLRGRWGVEAFFSEWIKSLKSYFGWFYLHREDSPSVIGLTICPLLSLAHYNLRTYTSYQGNNNDFGAIFFIEWLIQAFFCELQINEFKESLKVGCAFNTAEV